jgi:DeoR/GlpR family transcriptional regulator of sugar metabolism
MSPLERYYKIDQLLKDRQVVSFAVFKEKLGMSRASVKRDLEYMRSRFKAPIE